MELTITNHWKASPFADLTKEKKEFRKGGSPKSISKGGEVTSNLEGVEAKVYPFPDSDVPMILDELLAKKVIDLPESKRPEEINKANHASVASNQKKCSKSQIMPNTISLQLESFTPVEVDFPRKTSEGSLEIDDNEVDGWTLVTHKKRRHQEVLGIRLFKTGATRSDVNQLQPSKTSKPCTSQKINGSLSQKTKRRKAKASITQQ
ncbi:hypothetical protein KY290_000828 [Solanum tuberosum]|uniref:Uncharacterized protein n=1 Tax=Solanum tuberosum TaxID=4113 RepID=A0ABQ7WML8_SOLTU|nr:hypothetical protein KY290_000828 [Solanum tuberosum]